MRDHDIFQNWKKGNPPPNLIILNYFTEIHI